jgi:hypothetical protein
MTTWSLLLSSLGMKTYSSLSESSSSAADAAAGALAFFGAAGSRTWSWK